MATALCITIPKSISWESYKRELDDARRYNLVLNYKISSYPKQVKPGDRCYVVHNGMIRGWSRIVDIIEREESFNCMTTGRRWAAGVYVQRDGDFHYLTHPVEMKGFMGYRYINPDDIDRQQ